MAHSLDGLANVPLTARINSVRVTVNEHPERAPSGLWQRWRPSSPAANADPLKDY